jgi:hypothetical protein
MLIVRLLLIVLVLVLSLFSATTAYAYDGGINGRYQAGCGGGTCHGGAASANTVLTVGGTRTLAAGTTTALTITVANGGQNAAGFNAAVLNANNQPAGAFNNLGGGVQALPGDPVEVFHTEPKGFAAGQATFTFSWTAPATHGTYTMYYAGNAVNDNGGAAGDVWNTGNAQITVTGATLTAPAAGTSLCAGASLSVAWTQTGLTNFNIELSSDNFNTKTVIGNGVAAGSSPFSYTIPNNQAPGNTYQVRLITAAGAVLSTSNVFSITAGPAILTQPANQIACVGKTVVFTTGASGSNVQYRWRKNGVDIPGGTNAILTLNNLTLADAGTYDCNATACNITVATQTATLTVNIPPSITTQPVKQEICEGQAASFSVEAAGSDLTYQWLKDGVPIIGATNKDYRIPSPSLSDAGQYRCRITGSCTPQLQSAEAPLTVNVVPAVSVQPQPANVKVGEQILMFVVSTGQAVQYQWTKNGTDINGATNDTLLIPAASLSDSGTYAVKVSNTCGGATSRNAAVKVTPNAGGGVLTLGTSAVNMGDRAVCSKADTVITALLQNTGGTEFVATAATSDPAGMVTVTSPLFPAVIPPGSSVPVTMSVAATAVGTQTATVTFTSNVGDKTMTVTLNGTPSMATSTDTLRYAVGQTGESHCASTVPVACAATITEILIEGNGALTYTVDPPVTLPFEIPANQSFNVCVKSTDVSGEPARLVIKTTAGDADLDLVRSEVSSVDEEVSSIAGLHVAPNPMTDELRITTDTDAPINVRVHTITGSVVAQFSGVGEVRWDRRDLSGSRLPSGLYVLAIEQRGVTDVFKLLVE